MKTSVFTPILLVVASLSFLPNSLNSQTFSDSFDTDTSGNWLLFQGSSDGTPDYTAQFGYEYGTNRYILGTGASATTNFIPPAPTSVSTTKGLKLTVNKGDNLTNAAAVALFPNGQSFSNDYSVRVDMWMNYNGFAGAGSGSTEFATIGVNHTGTQVTWDNAAVPVGDGLWFAAAAEGGAARDYRAYDQIGELPGAAGGFLDHDGNAAVDVEATDPGAQMVFPAPPAESAGMAGKQWVQMEVRRFGGLTTWLMNGWVIGEHASTSFAGSNVMLGYMDIFASVANPRDQTYVIFDNLRVTNLTVQPSILTVAANDSDMSEPGNAGSFTITRTGDVSQPLTVYYQVSGTASNGVDFTSLPGSVVIPASSSSVDVPVSPINDSLAEVTETVVLSLLPKAYVYDLGLNTFATLNLVDDGDTSVVVTLTATKTNAYELNPKNEGRLSINFSGPTPPGLTINYTISGSASNGVHYTTLSGSASIPAASTNFVVRVNPINNALIDGNRTVVMTLASGAGYTLGTATNATVTIRDDDLPAGTLLYSENFDSDASPNWATYVSGGTCPVNFFYNYGETTIAIPPAPNSVGTTRGLKMGANIGSGVFGGVSVSPTGQSFSGDYRLRFDLWQNFNGPLTLGGNASTQLTGAGVGTAGATVQWPGGVQDSVWFAVTGDGQSSVDYRAYSSAASTGYVPASGVYSATGVEPRQNTNVYYAEFGREAAPADQLSNYGSQTGETSVGAPGFLWRDVVITKQGSTITWHLDGKLIATVNTNGVNFGGGNILFLHSDINAGSSSDGNAEALAFGLIDNVRVETLTVIPPQAPNITGIALTNNTAIITFTGATNDSAASFTVESVASLGSPFGSAGVTNQVLSPGVFQATVPISGASRFYRIRR
jgi:hypothetical protein